MIFEGELWFIIHQLSVTGPASSSFRRVSIPLPENIFIPGSNLLKPKIQGQTIQTPTETSNSKTSTTQEKITSWYTWPFGLPTQRLEEIPLESTLTVVNHPKNKTFYPESIIVQYQYRTGLKKSGIGIGIFVLKVKV